MISIEYKEAIVEILDILENSNDNIYKKIPKKLIEFWQKNKSTTYKPQLDHSKSLNEMNLKEKTKDIITMIYINYLCNESEKEATKNIIKENEKKHQLMLMEKYNTNNIFKNKENVECLEIVKYKESKFKKFINKLKDFLKNLSIKKD